MSELKMIAPAVPNVPWQDKPEGHKGAPVWRYSENPIIDRNESSLLIPLLRCEKEVLTTVKNL